MLSPPRPLVLPAAMDPPLSKDMYMFSVPHARTLQGSRLSLRSGLSMLLSLGPDSLSGSIGGSIVPAHCFSQKCARCEEAASCLCCVESSLGEPGLCPCEIPPSNLGWFFLPGEADPSPLSRTLQRPSRQNEGSGQEQCGRAA